MLPNHIIYTYGSGQIENKRYSKEYEKKLTKVVTRKLDGDLRICGDYKIGMNHQIGLDLFPLPNIETVSHELARMKYFTKIDPKSADNHTEIDEKFKEITTTIGLLRWTSLPLGIKTLSYIFHKWTEKKSYWEK